jgi:two-component system, cell cycle sensor histidine kinase and response regulator CckA
VSSTDGPSSAPDDPTGVEAFGRLDVGATPATPSLQELVELIAITLGASAVSIVRVEHERVRSIATTSTFEGMASIPRSWSLTDLLMDANEPWVVVPAAARTDRRSAESPSADPEDPATPTTLAAYALEAPGGDRIGAIEVAWDTRQDVGDDLLGYLERCSRLVTQLLDLEEEVSEYGRFVDLVPEPVVILDLDGAIEEINPAFLKLMGAQDEHSLVGRSFLELVERGDRARVTAELARALFMKRRRGRIELQLAVPGRGAVPCSVSAGHLRGLRRHLQLVVHDLSERLRVEDERSHLSEQLARAQRLDAVGQLAGGLAHDLNNLLVVMLSNLSLARESLEAALSDGGGASLEEVREDLGELQVAVDRAEGLTSKLLQFARQEEDAKGEANVVDVVAAAARLVERSLGDDIDLEFFIDGGVPAAAVDPVHLERVIVNLLINARDAIDAPGSICIEVDAPEDGSSVRVAVRDDGRGMDDATRARAFEPLFTTRGDAGGSGLGLATVLAFVEGVDGEVVLDSVPGEGTTVALILPVRGEEITDLPVGIDVPVAGARVVLVDPGERTRRVIAKMLKGAGYRVKAVVSAEAALELLREEGGDVLITELALPGMPGTRLIEEVRRFHPDVQRLVVAPIGQSTSLRATPVLAKPFSHARLIRMVEDLVRTR